MDASLELQDPGKADEVMNKIFAKRLQAMEEHKASGKGPRHFKDAYDCEKCEPKQELLDDYHRVKEELRAMGLTALK